MAERKLGFSYIQFHVLTEQLLNLKKGDEGVSTHPHLMCYLEVVDVNAKKVNVKVCIVCNCPFPLFDVIVNNCQYLYHPWCAPIWFKATSSYKEEHCTSVIHLEWLKSFGFASPTFKLE
jgi:hypothetical protein